MSWKISGQVWDLKLPHNKLLVLLAMADHADHEGRNIHPSMGLIAWKTGYSERHVRRIVKQLEDDKILVLEEARAGQTNLYRIDVTAGESKPPFKSDATDEAQVNKENHVKTGQNVTPDTQMSGGGRTPRCPGGADTQMSGEPSYKDQYNHTTVRGLSAAQPQRVISTVPLMLPAIAQSHRVEPSDADHDRQEAPSSEKSHREKVQALGDAFGQPPVTKQDYGLYGKVVNTFDEAGIAPDEYPLYIRRLRKTAHEQGWTVTIPSLIAKGRPSEYVAARDEYQSTQQSAGVIHIPPDPLQHVHEHMYEMINGGLDEAV